MARPTAIPFPSDAPAASGRRGFTLVEVTVALWILAVTLLAGMALVLQQPRVVRRIDADRQALQLLEWTVEEMRAGIIPLQSTPDVGWPAGSLSSGSPAAGMTVAVAVAPAQTAGLYNVLLVARYTVYGFPHQRQLQTMIFRPPGPPN